MSYLPPELKTLIYDYLPASLIVRLQPKQADYRTLVWRDFSVNQGDKQIYLAYHYIVDVIDTIFKRTGYSEYIDIKTVVNTYFAGSFVLPGSDQFLYLWLPGRFGGAIFNIADAPYARRVNWFIWLILSYYSATYPDSDIPFDTRVYRGNRLYRQQISPRDVYAEEPAFWPTGFKLLNTAEKMAQRDLLTGPVEMSLSDNFSRVTDLMNVTVYQVLID